MTYEIPSQGAAAADTSTIVAALVNGFTKSAFAAGAAAGIARYGQLFLQLFVAYFTQRRCKSPNNPTDLVRTLAHALRVSLWLCATSIAGPNGAAQLYER